jgi:hypothetical protein
MNPAVTARWHAKFAASVAEFDKTHTAPLSILDQALRDGLVSTRDELAEELAKWKEQHS